MNTKTILAVLLITMLLADSLNGLRWQAMGSGMNNTVITEIWTGLEANIDTALTANTHTEYNAFTKGISDRLNARWDPAWNVAFVMSQSEYEVILYGYAYNNQWMWFNGVPNTVWITDIVTLIVWKDYNCQAWYFSNVYGVSSFTTTQKAFLKAQTEKLTANELTNDVWGTAHSLMTKIQGNAEFSSGGYTMLMAQYHSASFHMYLCRMGYNHYNFYRQNQKAMTQGIGNYYLFQTR